MTEYNQLVGLDHQGGSRKLHAFEAHPIDESDMYAWDLRLYDFEDDQAIAADMRARKVDNLAMRIHFPQDYPNSPPFVYMLRPRLREGTGYVLNGGGICMELLTPSVSATPVPSMPSPRAADHVPRAAACADPWALTRRLCSPPWQEWSPATSINALVMSVRAMLLVGNARLKSTEPSAREPDYVFEEARHDFAHIVKVHKTIGWTSHPMFKNA